MCLNDYYKSEDKLRLVYAVFFTYVIRELMVMDENNSFHLVNTRIKLSV